MSSGRTFSITTKGLKQPFGLLDLTASIGNAESTPDRWAINVVNTDATSSINVGRSGVACIPLGPGVAYRFEGCALRDVTINDSGTQVVVAVDASDTLKERFAALLGK